MEISSNGDYLRHETLALSNPSITQDAAEAEEEAEDDEGTLDTKSEKTKTRRCKDIRFLVNQEGKLAELFIMMHDDKTLKEP